MLPDDLGGSSADVNGGSPNLNIVGMVVMRLEAKFLSDR